MLLAVVSSLAIAATYIWTPSDPDYAGAVFSWNVSFGWPMFGLSFICWMGALVFYVGYLRQNERRSKWKLVTPIIFMLPFIYELALYVLLVIRVRREIG